MPFHTDPKFPKFPRCEFWIRSLNPGGRSAFFLLVTEYTEETKKGTTLDSLIDEEAGLRLLINRSGAEMVSLARRDAEGNWRGFLHRDGQVEEPATGWANHATVMGYFLHRLWKEQSSYRGKVIRGGNHGFLRHVDFGPPEVRDGALVYRVSADQIPAEAYPLKVSFALTYSLSREGVRVEFAFTNEEPELEAHVSFGLHPGFAVNSPRTCRLHFPAGTYRRYWAPGNFLNGETEDFTILAGDMPMARETLPDSWLLGLDQLASRQFILEDHEIGHRLILDFSEVPFLTVWSDMNPFLCLEPCWGLPDNNPPKAFENKSGIQVIAPGATLERGFGILPEILS